MIAATRRVFRCTVEHVYAFGLILLSTLSFVGFVTLDRVLQSGIEELHYAERIARLRAYYFDSAPELTTTWPASRHRGGLPSWACAAGTGLPSGRPPE